VDDRERRIGQNEALFREVNERVARLSDSMHATRELTGFLCECGTGSCHERVEMTLEEYERVRTDATRFAIVPGHEVTDVEMVIAKYDRYWVIEKHEGEAAEFAEALDPRAGS
jgi:aerobic-type carbon monoxide dehydrogenase small subunit (CoxS/CutS family)